MPSVDDAFKTVPREFFVLPEYLTHAELDAALPIGYGQTISQPTTVRMMLEWLEVEEGNKILDVGSGSGWTSALLGRLTGPDGTVVATELIPELSELGQTNAKNAGVMNIKFQTAVEGKPGCPGQAPYDRILVSASADKIPYSLLEQLAAPGKAVMPVRHSVLEISKDETGMIDIKEHPGFVFVPFIE